MKIIALAILLLTSTAALAQTEHLQYVREPTVKVTPYFGITKIKNDYLDYSSTINPGGAIDFMLSSRFSIGPNFNYSLFKLYEEANLYSQKDIDLRQYNIGIMTKFFLVPVGSVRPFIGAGANYIHNRVDFASDGRRVNRVSDRYYTFGTIAATVTAGSEFRFSKNIGLVLDFKYARNLTVGFNQKVHGEDYTNALVPTVMKNREIDLKDANSLSGTVGIMFNY
ncbi:MAG: porin family protein [Deltaproteobacteria bacterium]|nr:MAG: porin family protein [Deltaproteobacteria bacterium]